MEKERTALGRPYHTIEKKDTQALAQLLVRNGQALLPMVELIEQSQLAVDELIDVLGRASIEALLRLSAEGVAGPPHPGKKGGVVGWHGGESGTVCLAENAKLKKLVADLSLDRHMLQEIVRKKL